MTDPEKPPANDNISPCPICKKAPSLRYRPFCSQRCADVDLHRWLTGTYAIPAEEEDIPEDGEPPAR